MLKMKTILVYFIVLAVLVQILQMVNFNNLNYEFYMQDIDLLKMMGSEKLVASLIASLLFFVLNLILALPLYLYLKYKNNDNYLYPTIFYIGLLSFVSFFVSNMYAVLFTLIYFTLIYFFMFVFAKKIYFKSTSVM